MEALTAGAVVLEKLIDRQAGCLKFEKHRAIVDAVVLLLQENLPRLPVI